MNMKGFTLIEVLVSVAIFASVMVIALGALLALSEANRKAQLLSSATNNFTSAIDSMSRAIRTGNVYHCGGGTLTDPLACAGGSTQFAFLAATGATVVYKLDTSSCENGVGCISRSQDGGNNYVSVTSPELVVTSLKFYVRGVAGSVQPQVFMLISGYVTITGVKQSVFNLQTSVTQRIYGQ
jgi:prepilin-type N-terminal cleavage/methylation domain-containing protein